MHDASGDSAFISIPCRKKFSAASRHYPDTFASKSRPSATAFATYASIVRVPFASAVHHLRVSHSDHPRKPLNHSAKTSRQRRHCETAHFALRFGPFHKLKRPISQCEMGRFATCFLLNQNTLIINVLHTRHYFFLMTLSTCEAKLLIPFTDGCPLFLSMSFRRITGTP